MFLNLDNYVHHRKATMMEAGKYWTQWKSKMTCLYIHGDNLFDHSPAEYEDFITQEEWIEFWAYRTFVDVGP